MPVYSLEGNIGSGKSTILDRIHQRCIQTNNKKVHIIPEAVEIWEKFKKDEKSILELFYQDKKTYAFPMQVLAFLTALYDIMGTLKSLKTGDIVITERSLESTITIFGELMYKEGYIDEVNWSILKYLANGMMMPVDKHIYIKVSTEVCYDRIKERSRNGEETISMDYLEKIEKQHEEWLGLSPHTILESDKDIAKFIDDLFDN
jgi:deoxyadenosine/deoxycytidine kinase